MTHFSAAHAIREIGGKCESLHGHNWRVEVSVGAESLDETGLVVDFRELKKSLAKVLDELDHSHLNELPHFKDGSPTSENIARYIFDQVAARLDKPGLKVTRVTAWESDTSAATYTA